MVECESKLHLTEERPQKGFNRYMVECELIYHKLIFVLRKVLIDTWWNVNFCVCPIQIRENLVLIDTWWNVNKGRRIAITNARGFNRYMVECECGRTRTGC